MTEALSSCEVMADGRGSSLASSRNSAFSFSLRERAAFLLFSFMMAAASKGRVLSLRQAGTRESALGKCFHGFQLHSVRGKEVRLIFLQIEGQFPFKKKLSRQSRSKSGKKLKAN